MKIAYFDCPTGISGDMCLGALVSAGVPLDYLQTQLAQLPLTDEYQLTAALCQHNNQQATKVTVELNLDHHPPHRHLADIQHLIQQAALPQRVVDWSLAVFEALAIAEAAVHGTTPEQVHFHEVGATDAIVDIVGTCLGLDWLNVDSIYCGSLPTGGGVVKAAHGSLPVPVPAVLKLWEQRQVPIYHNGIERELVTPTGAALMVVLATEFGPPPSLQLHNVGLGAGTRSLPIPNLLRLWLGESIPSPLTEQVMVLETQIDDASPQALAYAMEQLFAAGALDVFTQAIAMKKSRLGTLMTVICPCDRALACEQVLFQETPTLGIRRQLQERHILERNIFTIETEYGVVRIKVAVQQGQVLNVQPEYEDCALLAREHQQPWQTIHNLALEAWRDSAGVLFD
ncbi:MAG: nickel pincer cofactor biosynthesis protein LarC [Spirulina sp. SIO3F2]|nr:nickel pincer cofactor biosynthesis protein LarC [Spirulina sp. SIO3F2]